jgi:hypothetical protein
MEDFELEIKKEFISEALMNLRRGGTGVYVTRDFECSRGTAEQNFPSGTQS